jgi:hypothetical protein
MLLCWLLISSSAPSSSMVASGLSCAAYSTVAFRVDYVKAMEVVNLQLKVLKIRCWLLVSELLVLVKVEAF